MAALVLTNENLKAIGVVGGWAPGEYYATCRCCGKKYLGDKHSTQCFVCAVRDINTIANSKRAEDAVVRNAIERVNLAMSALERLDSVLGKMFVDAKQENRSCQ